MQKTIAIGLSLGVLLVGATVALTGQARSAETAPAPTFSKDVAPIVYKNCVGCHRPGESAPMSLLTYADARPWARAMSRRVTEGSMPPWHADAPTGTFENERGLSADEKAVIARWA
ncbi:MAG TPA: hypothetical protein VM846_13950, partial [Vicinamibacterales bacterium]|nr:hypothetical protein [Vicinamibacterales bacterium]